MPQPKLIHVLIRRHRKNSRCTQHRDSPGGGRKGAALCKRRREDLEDTKVYHQHLLELVEPWSLITKLVPLQGTHSAVFNYKIVPEN